MADAILASSGIYAIRNKVNGKRYIGSAINIRGRFKQHRSDLKCGRHFNAKLQSSWNKHGSDAFAFEIVELVEDRTMLVEREQFWIDWHGSSKARQGYNIRPIANSCLGIVRTKEFKQKVAASLRGRKRPAEVCAQISTSKMGSKRSDQARLNMSIAGKKRAPISDATRAKLSAAHTGRKHSDETKAKLSEQRKGVQKTPEQRARQSEALRGRKQSPESVEKRRQALLGRPRSQEVREKIRIASLNREQSKRESRELETKETEA